MKKEEKEPEAGSIVATIETREVATIPQPRNSFNGYNLDALFDLAHTTGAKIKSKLTVSKSFLPRHDKSTSPKRAQWPQLLPFG
jgi:hypothetical protein